MPRVTSAAVSPGRTAPGPAGPSASTCSSAAWRNCALAFADARTAPTSASQAIMPRAAKMAASTTTLSRTASHPASADVTETITSDSNRACRITRIAVITPSTTASTMKPRVLRA